LVALEPEEVTGLPGKSPEALAVTQVWPPIVRELLNRVSTNTRAFMRRFRVDHWVEKARGYGGAP
jgi:hypothetical protein